MMTEQDKPNDAIGESQEASPSGDRCDDLVEAVSGDVFCPDCGYNLRTLTSNRCPECGGDVHLVRERESQIPWVHRAKLGRVRAYWKTVWLVIVRNRRFCTEMARPVDLTSARRFRWVTVLLALLPIIAAIPVVLSFAFIPWTLDTQIWTAITLAALLAFFTMAPAVPYYAFRHRDLSLEAQHRAAVLLNYVCAPMAFMWIVFVCGLAGWFVTKHSGWWRDADLVLYMAAGGLALGIMCIMALDAARLVRKTVGEQRISRRINAKLGLVTFGVTLVTLIGIPIVGVGLAFFLCDVVF